MFKKTQLKKKKSFLGSQGWEASFNALLEEIFGENDYPNDGIQFEPIPLGTGFNWAGEFDWTEIANGDIVTDSTGITELYNLVLMPEDKDGNDISADINSVLDNSLNYIIKGDGVEAYNGGATISLADFTGLGDYELIVDGDVNFASAPTVVTIEVTPPNGTPSPQKSIRILDIAVQGSLKGKEASKDFDFNLQNFGKNRVNVTVEWHDSQIPNGTEYTPVLVLYGSGSIEKHIPLGNYKADDDLFGSNGNTWQAHYSLSEYYADSYEKWEIHFEGLTGGGDRYGYATFSDSGLRQNVE